MKLQDFDFDLPPDLIPAELQKPRDACRLIVLNRQTSGISHATFRDLPDLLRPGDLLILNNTRVIPCVLRGVTDSGQQIEIQVTSRKDATTWDCVVQTRRELTPASLLYFGENRELAGEVIAKNDFDTGWLIRFEAANHCDPLETIMGLGRYFLPLYLDQTLNDENDYQTIYASEPGSNQPPVAGIHFTNELFARLEARGISHAFITLNIGRLDRIQDFVGNHQLDVAQHKMYPEYCRVPSEVADVINGTHERGGRVIAVGTTVMRTLESMNDNGQVVSGGRWTDLYIHPGFKFSVVDGLISNLQPPMTTNLILACSFGGYEPVMRLYRTALKNRYKFLEFGDAALYL